MVGKILYVFVLTFLSTCYGSTIKATNGTLKISVVTTAGCTDTVYFIKEQLLPTYAEFGRFLEVEFHPWGRTVKNSDESLTCQFGPQDCWANRVHRCALNLLSENQDAQVAYMGCEFHDFLSRPAFLDGTLYCGFIAGLNRVSLNICVTTPLGEPLDYVAKQASKIPMEVINFVPAIVFNDNPDVDLWREAFLNLRDTVCKLLTEDPSTGINEC